MGLFWKRKSGDQFVSLKLNEPSPVKAPGDKAEKAPAKAVDREAEAEAAKNVPEVQPASAFPSAPAGTPLEPVPTGGGPTPIPREDTIPKALAAEVRPLSPARETAATRSEVQRQKPVASVP